MVVAETSPRYFAAWLIDLASGASQWHPIPDPSVEQFDHDWVSVEWFNGRWMVTRDCQGCSTVYLSTDGSTWIESEIRWNADAAPMPEYWDDFRPGDGWRSATWDTATGPDAIVAAFFARPLAYSEDGLTWLALAPPRDSGEGGDDEGGGEWVALAYSDELGFVAVSPGGRFMQMENGQTWQYAGRWSEEIPGRAHLTASDSQMLLVRTEEHEAGVVSLWLWTSK
jgi:hypothetical protein